MKKFKQIVPLCILISIVAFFAITTFMIKGSIEECNAAKLRNIDAQQTLQQEQQKDKEITEQKERDELELSSIKPVFKAPANSSGENLGIFGGMFDQIIELSRNNGLLLRSIEYNMNPNTDSVMVDFSSEYNVCELNFFFVGTYLQLKSFLVALINDFEYLVSISKLDVTTFKANTDYILINMSITMYSKKTK